MQSIVRTLAGIVLLLAMVLLPSLWGDGISSHVFAEDPVACDGTSPENTKKGGSCLRGKESDKCGTLNQQLNCSGTVWVVVVDPANQIDLHTYKDKCSNPTTNKVIRCITFKQECAKEYICRPDANLAKCEAGAAKVDYKKDPIVRNAATKVNDATCFPPNS